VLLYFVPDVLHDETAVMREIVDKHFVDNWVVLYVTGHTVDLTLQWSKYHAANAALQNVIDPATAKRIQTAATAELGPLRRRLAEYLSEGVLTDQYVLRHMDDVMGVLRHCNVALQWTLLHSTTRNRKLLDAMHNHAPAADDVLGMLLDVADVEFRLREVYEGLLASKEERWAASQRAAVEAVAELGEFFSGSKVLSKHIKDDNLKNWFGSIQAEVEKLAAEEPVVAGRRIQQLIVALEAVEQFHQFDRVLQTKQYLLETRQHLMDMVRTANVQHEALYTFAVVSDFSYAFGPILAAYTPHMHRRIQSQPFAVLKLQCLFLKLKSMMELPLLRISQCGSPDLVSVSEYYSHELISYVREVMEVIPASMFSTLDTIIGLQTGRLRELPTKLEKDRLKEFAQLQERYLLAHATHGIAIFTQGILAMERTLMGVIEIDPRQLLEEGIRKQLVMRISEIAHTELQFTVKETSMFGMVRWVERDFEERLRALSARLAGFRRSFEYIQDYVCIYGLRVWQEEFQRIINYNVEQECNTFLKRQVRATLRVVWAQG
jgi:WASH complex subunit strumpellin